ncbi:hypothetical protein C8F01DRAFT_1081503 [Mycena amicta]|nr:hypothetical protein C8F01DRAFT_1081503 [Mycena amicta]
MDKTHCLTVLATPYTGCWPSSSSWSWRCTWPPTEHLSATEDPGSRLALSSGLEHGKRCCALLVGTWWPLRTPTLHEEDTHAHARINAQRITAPTNRERSYASTRPGPKSTEPPTQATNPVRSGASARKGNGEEQGLEERAYGSRTRASGAYAHGEPGRRKRSEPCLKRKNPMARIHETERHHLIPERTKNERRSFSTIILTLEPED